MAKSLLITLTFLYFALNAQAFENDFFVSGGAGLSRTNTTTYYKTTDKNLGVALSTRFGYRLKIIEFNFSSYINIGRVKADNLPSDNGLVTGEGYVATSAFSPMVKIIYPEPIKNNWHLYIMFGPTWAAHEMRLREFELDGEELGLDKDDKFVYNTKGYSLVLGIEEINIAKKQHPIFIEFVYSYLKAYQVHKVDASDMLEVTTLSSKDIDYDLHGRYFLINIGITIF